MRKILLVSGVLLLIWLSANQVSRLHVRWGTKPDALDQRSAEVELNATMDYTGHVALTGLPRGATVYYRAFAGDSAVSASRVLMVLAGGCRRSMSWPARI